MLGRFRAQRLDFYPLQIERISWATKRLRELQAAKQGGVSAGGADTSSVAKDGEAPGQAPVIPTPTPPPPLQQGSEPGVALNTTDVALSD